MKFIKYITIATIVLFGLGAASLALANPFYTGTRSQTAAATTTVTYMTPGAATTTPIYDSYEQYGTNQTNAGNTTIPDSVAVLVQGNASSTATVVNVACEFSDTYVGSTGNGDWYQNEVLVPTTTGATAIINPITYTFTYASSTVGGVGVIASTSRFQKLVTCPVPLRYVRAVITITGANASLWAAIIPKKQRN